jgi:hypothetical protein
MRRILFFCEMDDCDRAATALVEGRFLCSAHALRRIQRVRPVDADEHVQRADADWLRPIMIQEANGDTELT